MRTTTVFLFIALCACSQEGATEDTRSPSRSTGTYTVAVDAGAPADTGVTANDTRALARDTSLLLPDTVGTADDARIEMGPDAERYDAKLVAGFSPEQLEAMNPAKGCGTCVPESCKALTSGSTLAWDCVGTCKFVACGDAGSRDK